MHVLIVVPWDQERGGVAAVVGNVATYLERHGHQVSFLHPGVGLRPRASRTKWGFRGYRQNLRPPVVPEAPLRSRLAFALTAPLALAHLARLVRRLRVDVVNVHYPGPSGVHFALLRRLGLARLVVSIHGTDVLRPEHAGGLPPSLRFLLRTADRIVSPSAGFLADCAPLLGDGVAPATVIHNGADLRVFRRPGADDPPRASDVLLCAATLDEWKGIDVLLRALAQLRAERPSPRLLLAGKGPRHDELRSLVASLGLDDAVAFLGDVPPEELAARMRACTAFVLPSRSEPFGIVLAEAMASGAPVVATRVGGIPEVLDEGRAGVLVPPDDVPALAAGIRRVLTDAALRGRLEAEGPARAAATFSWDRTGERYAAELGALVATGR